jgi:ribonucleoside-triphosphate reductase
MMKVTQRFKLAVETINTLNTLTPEFGYNGLGYVVFKRTYARGNEDWVDVVIRVIEGVMSIRKEHFYRNSLYWNDDDWKSYAHEMALSMFKMEWLPPGRGLWMMGTEFVYTHGSMSLYNCGAVDTRDDFVLSAEWAMDSLMNGVGVGFSTDWRGSATRPDKNDYEFYQVADSREGWTNSVAKLLSSYIYSKKFGKSKFPMFDYSLIRKAGVPIKGFGGLASGPDCLIKLHSRLESYLDCFCDGYIEVVNSNGKRSRNNYDHTRFIADVFNSIGACVVAGNVRRSAEISLGDVHDDTFMNLKNYSKNPERGEIGWMSNNSVVLKPNQNYEDFSFIPDLAKRIIDNGEPGMINLINIQKYGRYGKYMADKATLVNPCGEISLEDAETCNLAEVFPTRCSSVERFYKSLEYATFYATNVSLLPTHRPETNSVVAKNRRIGVSISGIAQWSSLKSNNNSNTSDQSTQSNTSTQSGWGDMNYTRMTKYLRNGYNIVKEYNVKLSNIAGVPPSIRVTTIKPSGSISLLVGCTSGVHYPVSRYAIRRMRIGKDSPLVKPMIEAGIHSEPDKYSDNTLVFSFAIDHGDVRPCEEVSPWEQFSIVAMLQRCYADNCVSATIYFDKVKDANDIEKMLAMYIPVLKSVSMLPHSGHGYEQAPYEPITREAYEAMVKTYTIPNFSSISKNVPIGVRYCTNDTCEL